MTAAPTVPDPTPSTLDEDAARAVWLYVLALVAAGLPVPTSVTVSARTATAHLGVPTASDVTSWATAIGAPEPVVFVCVDPGDESRLLHQTSTSATVEAGTWLTVSHLAITPNPDHPTPTDGERS